MTLIRHFAVFPLALLALLPLLSCSAEIEPEPSTVSSTTTDVGALAEEEDSFRDSYEVVRGDTLIAIADRFGVDLNDLVRENNIADPTMIYVGQILLIPPPPNKDDGPLLTIPPPTDPQLPTVEPTTSVSENET
ncbi:MAG: LysM peptidoglycan-binding domain-containing protein [Actinomycetota bacterium]|nr:LysM peptidoglycan-binding domain-containing protein [Actinomycetota bacterium]MED6303948.1 LysM peptidoglycan-binding domain-containing protein [Actinomycetota bacterium]